MVQVCFVLDLRSLAPPLLRDLKQSLLQLANFYAISSSPSSPSATLVDKIGLCYIIKNRLSSSDELKIAYTPTGNFNLRDFHHAVNYLPSDAFLPHIDNNSDVMISNVLSDRVLYSWQGKDIERKVIIITSSLPEDVDSIMQKSLMDAADKCVSVDFAVFQQKSSHLNDIRENINNFRRCISHLDNCSIQTYIPDFRVFHSLVRRWLQVLKDDMEEPLLARLTFKENLLDSVNHIFCIMFALVNPITKSFSHCQACRCHGIPLGDVDKNFNRLYCPVTGCNLETCDVIENSVRLAEKTVLFLPSFHNPLKLLQIASPIDITVTARTNLASLDEGLIMGAPFVVIPSPYHVIEATSDDVDQSDVNAQLFQGLSNVLHSKDQGLICSSNCDLETMAEAPYHCYYILQPSDNGQMLLKRLAGAEEVLRVPDNRLSDSSVNKEIANSVQACLLKIDLTDYDPLLHERGFHQKLNLLVKESLQLGSVFPKLESAFSELSSSQQPSSEMIGKAGSAIDVIVVDDESMPLNITDQDDKTMTCIAEEWKQLVVNEDPEMNSPSSMSKSKLEQSSVFPKLESAFFELSSGQKPSSEVIRKAGSAIDVIIVDEESMPLNITDQDDKTMACIAEEWKQLVVNDDPRMNSPSSMSKAKLDQSSVSPRDGNRQLDRETSRILERLEVPRPLKVKAASPVCNESCMKNTSLPTKKPLIPFQPTQGTEQVFVGSQLMKPTFQRQRRKLR